MFNFAFFGTGGLLSSICLNHLAAMNNKPTIVFIQHQLHSLYPNLTELVCINERIPYHLIEKVNDPKSLELILSYKPSFAVIASFGEIFKKPLVGSFPIYNVHMGVLPDFRGAYTNFWKLMQNDDVYGVTIHEIDERIDSGNSLLIVEKDFSSIVSSGEFFRANYQMAAEALQDVLELIKRNELNPQPISTERGKYYRKHTVEDMQLNPEEDVELLYKKINRLQFYGLPMLDDYPIFSCELLYKGNMNRTTISITPVSNSTFILKNKTGILLLRHNLFTN